MSREVPGGAIAHAVVIGENLRLALSDDLRRAGVAEKPSIHTELMMFYGQAFRHVYDACIEPPTQSARMVKVIHECVCGLAIFEVWLIAETPLDAQEDHERMAAHWRKVTEMMLRKNESEE